MTRSECINRLLNLHVFCILCISSFSYIDISAGLLISKMQDVLPPTLVRSEDPSLAAS